MGDRAPIIPKRRKNMKTNKKRIVLSALSLVLVFCLMAGGTMAWFTDTEKVAGNFSAGVLEDVYKRQMQGFGHWKCIRISMDWTGSS